MREDPQFNVLWVVLELHTFSFAYLDFAEIQCRTHVQQLLRGNMRVLYGRHARSVVQVPCDPGRGRWRELRNTFAVSVLVVAAQ